MGVDLQDGQVAPGRVLVRSHGLPEYVRWTGELWPGGQAAVERLRERRISAHVCAPMTLHLNKRKVCELDYGFLRPCAGPD